MYVGGMGSVQQRSTNTNRSTAACIARQHMLACVRGEPSDAKRLRALEDENGKLKKLLAEQMLDNAMLQDINSKNGDACCEAGSGGSSSMAIKRKTLISCCPGTGRAEKPLAMKLHPTAVHFLEDTIIRRFFTPKRSRLEDGGFGPMSGY